ncbi:mannosyl-oligosaccharide glucosidase-like isoform X2 [Liolophura sinensis]|uniref:mannosyl-oligosaccharide glucosidase-like isoform X2 n=1 Tax=Liolophura sinensis TaxID=3198878 RepID=UPI00315801CD
MTMGRNRADIRKRTSKHSDNNLKASFPVHRGHGGHANVGSGLLTKLTVAILFIAALAVPGIYLYQRYLEDRVKTPLDSPKMLAPNSSSAVMCPDRYWGSYRPHMYFGMKTRTSHSPVVGLMWLTQFTREMPAPVRHWCDEGDHLTKYGWLKHDGANFGVQKIEDQYFTMMTEFVKKPGGTHGGDWSARISVQSKDRPVVMSLMFYIALDGPGELEPTIKKGRLDHIRGETDELGQFMLQFSRSDAATVKYDYLVTYAKQLDKLKDYVLNGFKIEAWDKARTMPYFSLDGRKMPKDAPGGANFMVHQVTGTVPFSLEVVFESGSVPHRIQSLAGPVFIEELSKQVTAFNHRFEETFKLREKGFHENEIQFAQAALSNMLGSVGYFYGSSLVQSKYNKEPVAYWEAPLYSGVPSRPFFPRGFLWDEGFHNLLISQWDLDISKDIISHWLDLLNVEGWIPREQILGDEARAKVPAEFVVQRNENANPPTLFLPLQKIVNMLIRSNQLGRYNSFLEPLFPRLKAWYNWYNTTQLGEKAGTYRWRGRDRTVLTQLNPMTLTSGLDDYPRASHPTDQEFHVDLRSWMTLASEVMADLAKALNQNSGDYQTTYDYLRDNQRLDTLHWSETQGMYADFGLHTDGVKFHKPKPGERPAPQGFTKIRVETKKPTYQFVNSFGYVSLFPFLLKIIDPSSPKLFKILTDLKNPGLLWTDYGLRSLAKNAHLYNRRNTEHDPPYWRGAIWINMNYLSLAALHHYSSTEGPYQRTAKDVYTDLRTNLISNVIRQYEKTGYIWEQYNDKTGEGMRSHPFTGWSALMVLIMSEKY